jgi:cell division protein FtsL
MNFAQYQTRTTVRISALAQIFEKRTVEIWLLGALVLGSALGVVYSKHLYRSRHIQLQQLQNTRDKLHVEWTQLLLEQGTLGSDVQVEKIAREQLGMIMLSPKQMVVIKP